MEQTTENQVPGSPVSTVQNNSLMGVGALLKESWKRLVERGKVVFALEVLGLIPFVIGFLILFTFVLPATKDAVTNTPDTQKEISFPLNLQGGELKVSDQPNVKTSVPLSALPASARAMMSIAWIVFVVGGIVRLAIWNGQIYALGSEVIPTTGAAFSHGWKRWFPTLGHLILLTIIFTPLVLLMLLPFLGAALGALLLVFGGAQAAGFLKTAALVGGLLLLLVLPLYIFLFVRLSFVLLLAGLGESSGAFSESWQITKGRFWAIFTRLVALSFIMTLLLAPFQLVINFLAVGQMQSGVIVAIGTIVMMVLQFALALYGISYSVTLLRNAQRTQTITGGSGVNPVAIISIVVLILLVLAGAGVVAYNKINSFKESYKTPTTTGAQQSVATVPSPNQELLGERYTHPTLGFSIQPPKGWKGTWERTNEPTSGTYSMCPPERAHCLSVNIAPLSFYRQPENTTIDEYIAQLEQQQAIVGKFFPADDNKTTTREKYRFGSADGYIVTETRKVPFEDPFDHSSTSISRDLFAIKSPLRYNIHDPFNDTERTKYGPLLEATILSFKVE